MPAKWLTFLSKTDLFIGGYFAMSKKTIHPSFFLQQLSTTNEDGDSIDKLLAQNINDSNMFPPELINQEKVKM
jgi:hypothetical protein